MLVSEMVRHIELAEERGLKTPMIIAIILTQQDELKARGNPTAEEICGDLFIPNSYKHQIRSLFKVKEELALIGYKLVKK